MFYVVLALAYSEEFSTGKHHQLMGWFNKKYVYENKIFEPELSKIYQKLLACRESFDYNVSEIPNYEIVTKNLEKAKYFVDKVKVYILSL